MHLEINTLSLVIFKHIYKYYTGIMIFSPSKAYENSEGNQHETN